MLPSPAARADEGECVTSAFQITAKFSLAFVDGGAEADALPTLVDSALGLADCLCDAADVMVAIQLLSSSLTFQQAVPLEVWVGQNCDLPINRVINSALCKQIPTTLSSINFSTGSTGPSFQSIAVRDLLDPGGASPGACNPGVQANNSVWFIFNPSTPNPDFCQFTIPIGTLPPGAPQGVATTAGPASVTLTWNPPPLTQPKPLFYQVLCADENGAPVPSLHSPIASRVYDTCAKSGAIGRRNLTGNAGALDDGVGPPPAGAGTLGPAPFENLDGDFICSGAISGEQTLVDIDALPVGKKITFVVVAADAFGNATPSATVTATPLAPAAAPGCACAVAARPAPPIAVAVLIAGAGLALVRRTRTRAL